MDIDGSDLKCCINNSILYFVYNECLFCIYFCTLKKYFYMHILTICYFKILLFHNTTRVCKDVVYIQKSEKYSLTLLVWVA